MVEKAGVKLSSRTHPLYDENLSDWELYKAAVKGGESFINSNNLFSHRLEDATDYDERLERAYYLNFCEAIPSIYNSYIFKERIERAPDPLLEQFRANVDRRGTSISEFVARIGFFSKVYGAMHVLVDMPATKTENPKITRRYAKENNIYPYCSLIYPEQLVDWSLDEDGNFRWVIIKSTYYLDEDPSVERQEKDHYKLITPKEWRIVDEDDNPAELSEGIPNSGPNKLGFVPIITLYHRDLDNDKIGESILKDVVYVNRAILNWCSCIDEQIERQTFSQLIVPDDGSLGEASETGDDPLRRIGTSSAWTFPADATNPPQFISPSTQSIETVWNLVVDHIKEIFRISGLIGSSEDLYVSRSGRAAQMGFLGVNSALAETAKRYQQFENEISSVAYTQLGKDPSTFEEVKYPDSFDLGTLEDEIDAFFKVMERNFSKRLNKTIMKDISRRAVPLAPQSIRKEIEDEIESSDGIVKSVMVEAREAGSKEGQDGNPNTSNIQDSFRTKGKTKKEESQHRTEE